MKIKTIRLGVMVNSKRISSWQYEALNQALKINNVELCLIIKKRNKKLLFGNLKGFFFKFFQKIAFRKCNKTSYDLTNFFPNVKLIQVETSRNGHKESLAQVDINRIKKSNLDIIIRYGFGILSGDILDISSYGIWSFHHGDERLYRGSPAGFWEVYNRELTSGIILQRLTEDLDAGYIIDRAIVKTNALYGKNANSLFLASTPLIKRAIFLINTGGYTETLSTTKSKIYKKPTLINLIVYFVRSRANILKTGINRLFFYEDWYIAISNKKGTEQLLSVKTIEDYYVLKKSDKYFLADPFWKDKNEIFAEQFFFKEAIGRICKIKIDDNRHIIKKEIVEFPKHDKSHLSYPSIQEINGEIYITPEMSNFHEQYFFSINGSKVKKINCTINEQIIDPTIFFYSGKFWLLGSLKNQGSNNNLIIYYTDSLQKGWKEHPLNPVKIDIQSSRMAGNIFECQNKFYRLAQDCKNGYGKKVKVFEILKLTTQEYKEKLVNTIEAPRGFDGIHTININPKTHEIVFDIKKERYSFKGLYMKIKRRVY